MKPTFAVRQMLYRGAFSVGNPSGGLFFNPFDFSVKGIANTSILAFGGKILALYEVGSVTTCLFSASCYLFRAASSCACVTSCFAVSCQVN